MTSATISGLSKRPWHAEVAPMAGWWDLTSSSEASTPSRPFRTHHNTRRKPAHSRRRGNNDSIPPTSRCSRWYCQLGAVDMQWPNGYLDEPDLPWLSLVHTYVVPCRKPVVLDLLTSSCLDVKVG